MSTTLATPSANNAKMRWQEPYVSDGLNAKLKGLVPAGVVCGGRLVSAGAGLLVTITADPNTGDSVYSYINANGRQLTFRQIGNVTLDLNVGGVPGTTVFIGLEITYVVSAATLVYWRAYSQAEVDANPYLVILGRVVVPGVGPIPAANVTPLERRDSWLTISPGTREWFQAALNGSFDHAKAGTITNSEDTEPPHWDSKDIVTGTGVQFAIDQVNPRTGDNCLKLTGDGTNANASSLWNERYAAIRPGQFVRASMWVAGNAVSVGGFGAGGDMAIRLYFLDHDYGIISFVDVCNANLEDGTFGYTEFTEVVEAPVTSAWVYWGIRARDDTTIMTGSYFVDDVKVWLESGPPQEDDNQERILIDSLPPLTSMDIAPFGASIASMADALAKVLRLRFDQLSGGVMEYEWKHRSGSIDWLLKLLKGGVQIDRAIEALGSDLIGSAAEGAMPRIQSSIPASATARHVLLWEVINNGSTDCMRMYASDQSTALALGDALFFTVNAKWNGTQWERDGAGRSLRFEFQGDVFGCMIYEATSPSPWDEADWSDATNGYRYLRMDLGGVGRADLDLRGALNLTDMNGSASEAAVPRITMDAALPAASTYTLLSKIDLATAGVGPFRIFSSETSIVPSTVAAPGLFATINCYWSAPNWVADNPGSPAYLFVVSQDGLAYYRMPGASTGAPWASSQWTSGAGVPIWEIVNRALNDEGDARVNDLRLTISNPTDFTNPLKGINPLTNSLYAKNIVKAWAKIETGVGGPTVLDGFGVKEASCVYVGQVVEIHLWDVMSPAGGLGGAGDFCVVATGDTTAGVMNLCAVDSMGLSGGDSSFRIRFAEFPLPAGILTMVDLSTETRYIMFVVLGEQ